MTQVSKDQLRSIIERIENLEESKAAIAADIREIFAEAGSNGYDVKALRQVLKLRKMEAHEREEREQIVDVYLHALSMADSVEE